jgi:ribosomal protein L11
MTDKKTDNKKGLDIPVQIFKTIDNKVIIYTDVKFVEILQKLGVLRQGTNEDKKKWGDVTWGDNKKDNSNKLGGVRLG